MPESVPIQRHFNSVQQAEAWARTLGVTAKYADRLDIADLCNELLAQLSNRNIVLPEQIEVNAEIFRHLGPQAYQVPASARKERIAVNPDALYWRNPGYIADLMRRQKFWASDHPLHPLYHEMGHVLTYRVHPDTPGVLRDLRALQKTLASDELGRRSCEDIYEFLAEVFAGLMAGRIFSRDILRWYRARGRVIP